MNNRFAHINILRLHETTETRLLTEGTLESPTKKDYVWMQFVKLNKD